MRKESRREFVKSTGAAACAAAMASTLGGTVFAKTRLAESLAIKKGVLLDMLPTNLSYAERLKLAREIGFEVLQAPTEPDEHKAEELKKAADGAQIRIDSVMNMDHWKYPLSSSDPAVVEKSLAGMRTSLHNARLWGSDVVLLVPAVVNPQTSYRDAWTRSQREIRKLIPLAEELKVVIGIEEVWNKFLLSPLEMARYIDDFKSPWIRAYFDVGNVVISGYPQDWIRTLGKRIIKLHIKDFKFEKREVAEWVPLREGEINWPEVYKAL